MSDEFILHASFKIQSIKHFEDIEALIEHLELNEQTEAIAILKSYSHEKITSSFTNVLTPYSNYQAGGDFISMYLQTYDDSVDDMELTFDKRNMTVSIGVEGQDHDAADYCSALILLIIASGGANIKAKASTDYWQAIWAENNQGQVQLHLEEAEI
jgi:hypothetical protein